MYNQNIYPLKNLVPLMSTIQLSMKKKSLSRCMTMLYTVFINVVVSNDLVNGLISQIIT